MVKRAVLVGLDVYPDPRNNLNSCVADTLAFRQLLRSAYGFEDITLLHNSDATLANVTAALDALFADASPGDQLVYFESSHGYQYPDGNTMIQVLCLYDQFLKDTDLSSRTQGLPPGVLTVVLDACHSGGMNKVFFPEGDVQIARAKVWLPSDEDAFKTAQTASMVTSFKFFGQSATADVGAVALNLMQALPPGVAPQKDLSEGAVDLNAALFAACQADQTAAAGCPATNNLSAFTYAVTSDAVVSGPAPTSNAIAAPIGLDQLCSRVVQRLERLNMSQTPVALVPPTHPEQLTETFITMRQPSPAPDSSSPASSGDSSATPAQTGFDTAAWLAGQLAG